MCFIPSMRCVNVFACSDRLKAVVDTCVYVFLFRLVRLFLLTHKHL